MAKMEVENLRFWKQSLLLTASTQRDVYKRQLEGNGYLVSWCVGHLVELAPPNVYDAKYVKWSIADLPILPQKWQYLVSEMCIRDRHYFWQHAGERHRAFHAAIQHDADGRRPPCLLYTSAMRG